MTVGKQILALLLAVLLTCAGVITAAASLGEKTQGVTYRENRLYGDPAAAEGLIIQAEYDYRDHPFWQVEHSPVWGEKTRTQHRFYTVTPENTAENTYFGVEMRGVGEHYSTDTLDELLRLERSRGNTPTEGLLKAYQQLEEATPPGELTNTYIRYGDYCQYYPISGYLNTEKGSFFWNPYSAASYLAKGEAMAKAINAYFRIPVLEDDWLQIVIDKRTGPVLESVDITEQRKGEDCFQLWTVSTCSEGSVYFTFDPHTTNGKPVDTGLIPGGYGLYRFTYDEFGRMNSDSLTTMFSLDASHRPEELKVEDGKLYYFSSKEDVFWLTVFDLETSALLQQFCIQERAQDSWRFYLLREDMLYGVSDERICIWQKNAQGLYDWHFSVPLPENDREDLLYNHYDALYAFDGERLAVVNILKKQQDMGAYGYNRQLCGYRLSVFGKEGLLYRGEYTSSLEPALDIPEISRYCTAEAMDVFWQ